MNKFDPTKPVQTRDGRKARILCTDLKTDQPIVAAVTNRCGEEFAHRFSISGHFYPSQTVADIDLINIPEEPKWRAWNKFSELPDNAWFRLKNQGHTSVWRLSGFDPETNTLRMSFGRWVNQADYEYSLDRCQTWLPCGILTTQ
jgi:hypothetical protein